MPERIILEGNNPMYLHKRFNEAVFDINTRAPQGFKLSSDINGQERRYSITDVAKQIEIHHQVSKGDPQGKFSVSAKGKKIEPEAKAEKRANALFDRLKKAPSTKP